MAMIMAGGRGSRLEDLTAIRAKPATPFGGKFRIIDFPLSNCVNSGIRQVFVLTQYKAHSLIQHIHRGWGYLRGEFGEFITDPEQAKSAPRVFFTQIDFNIGEFISQLEQNPFHSSPIPNVHPQKLLEQVHEVRQNPAKRVKGISLDSAFGQISFLKFRTGFWLAGKGELLFYPMPDHETLEKEHYKWFRSLEP